MRFAGLRPEITDRFAGPTTQTAVTGCPLLPDSLAWVDCTVWAMYDGGDHTIFVGEVQDLSVSDLDMPLLYHNRLWRRSEWQAITSGAVRHANRRPSRSRRQEFRW